MKLLGGMNGSGKAVGKKKRVMSAAARAKIGGQQKSAGQSLGQRRRRGNTSDAQAGRMRRPRYKPSFFKYSSSFSVIGLFISAKYFVNSSYLCARNKVRMRPLSAPPLQSNPQGIVSLFVPKLVLAAHREQISPLLSSRFPPSGSYQRKSSIVKQRNVIPSVL